MFLYKIIKIANDKNRSITSRTGDDVHMMEKHIKDLAWNTFKQTGNIDTFMELMQVENIQKNNQENVKENIAKNIEEIQYGDYKNKGNNNF